MSVIIATKNRAKPLQRCITSLLRQKRLPDELIVVDASTNDDTKRMIENLNSNFRVVYVRQMRGGLPTARQIGIKECGGDIEVFLDDDVVLDPVYLGEILAAYDGDEDGCLGGVTGVDIRRGQTQTNLQKFLDFIRVLFFWNSIRDGRVTCIGMLSRLPRTLSYVEAFFGHNMSFRKHIFSEFEFNEELEIYPLAMGEDIDFSCRVGKRYLLKVNPSAKLMHEGPSREDYKFTFDFYRHSSMMFVRNSYLIMCSIIGKSPLNKLAFLWSIFGLVLGRIALYLMYPAEKKKVGLRGIVSGLRLVLNGV